MARAPGQASASPAGPSAHSHFGSQQDHIEQPTSINEVSSSILGTGCWAAMRNVCIVYEGLGTSVLFCNRGGPPGGGWGGMGQGARVRHWQLGL